MARQPNGASCRDALSRRFSPLWGCRSAHLPPSSLRSELATVRNPSFGDSKATSRRQRHVLLAAQHKSSSVTIRLFSAAKALMAIARKAVVGQMSRMPSSMTILIHGRWSTSNRWYRPGSSFHDYIHQHGFSDVYSGDDYFYWSGENVDRKRAAKELIQWCKDHPARKYRLMGHSQGANVANWLTQLIRPSDGIDVCTLVHLCPVAVREFLPNLSNLSSGEFFTVHPIRDLVVQRHPNADQDYQNYQALRDHETVVFCGPRGHYSSVDEDKWDEYGIGDAVTTVCRVRSSVPSMKHRSVVKRRSNVRSLAKISKRGRPQR